MIARFGPYLALVVTAVIFIVALILIADPSAVDRVRASIERQNNASGDYRIATAAALAIVSMGAACGTTAPASAPGLRRIVGTDLIGARGATPQDQRKIDLTVVRHLRR